MKITIITVCYNSEKTIEDTIKSVLMQKYDNYEYLIIDGKSKDNTVKIAKKYAKKFKGKMKIISERDNGLYDAMNKGIKLATGDIIGIINSDDILINEQVFGKIVSNFNDNIDAVYGNVLYCNENFTKVIRNYKSGVVKHIYDCPAHPTLYIKKEIFDTYGYYNLDYKICADYDFMVRLNKNKIRYKYINEYLVLMRIGGVSNGLKGYIKNFKDSRNILKNNNIKFPTIKTIIRSFQTINQIIISKFNKKDSHILYDKKI